MPEELRKFDTTIGRCKHCGEMVLLEESGFSDYITHEECSRKYILKASQI